MAIEAIGADNAHKIAEEMEVDVRHLRPLPLDQKKSLSHFMDTVEGGEPFLDLKQVSFRRLYFDEDVDFSQFLSPAVSFSECYFKSDAYFRGAHFREEANFERCCFGGKATFESARFYDSVSFKDTYFSGKATFSNGAFEGVTDLSEVRFTKHVPDFFQREFHDNTRFTAEKEYWPPVVPERAQEDKDSYRRLRQVSAAQQNPENEHFFLRQEMACSGVDPKKDWISRFVVRAFGFFSDYGYSIWRPLFGLVGIWIGGALLIQTVLAWHTVYGVELSKKLGVPGLADALGLGLSNTFAIFGFRTFYWGDEAMVSLPTFVKVVGGAQTILGFVFLFVLGLGLRNRFRLR